MNVSVAVRLSNELVEKAKKASNFYNRSLPKQIEYWAKLGRMAEENSDLPLDFLKGVLEAREEEAIPFEFRKK